jgi:hypothetical protein
MLGTIRDRVVGFQRIRASELEPHPENRASRRSCRQRLQSRDRRGVSTLTPETVPEMEVPCVVLDLDDTEARKVLATLLLRQQVEESAGFQHVPLDPAVVSASEEREAFDQGEMLLDSRALLTARHTLLLVAVARRRCLARPPTGIPGGPMLPFPGLFPDIVSGNSPRGRAVLRVDFSQPRLAALGSTEIEPRLVLLKLDRAERRIVAATTR